MIRFGALYLIALLLPPAALHSSDGFGGSATGGAGGKAVTVKTPAGFLYAVQRSEPSIITVSGTITYAGDINVASNKTIQGADVNATIKGDLRIGKGVRNIIVKNLNFTNPVRVGSGDGITVAGGHVVLIMHCTFTDCADGSCDIGSQSDSVTLSWCRFRYVKQTNHRYVNLVGSSDDAPDLGYLHVTIHHCWYDKGCHQRMPSVRFGRVHVYNNYYGTGGTASYGVRTRLFAECLVENNYFEMMQNPWEMLRNTGVTDGKLRAAGNNIAFPDSSYGVKWRSGWYMAAGQIAVLVPGTDSVFTPPYQYTLTKASDVMRLVMKSAGNMGK